MRAYQKSNPWITFDFDTRAASADLWISLGEAQGRCEDIARVPLRPDIAESLHNLYLAKGVMATTAIEGNTLTEDEVRDIIRGTLQLPPSREYLKREVDNILEACNVVVGDLEIGERIFLTSELLGGFNTTVLKGLHLEEGAKAGQLRVRSVGVGTYRAVPAEDWAYLLDRTCKWLNSRDFAPGKGVKIVTGLVKAIVAHVYFVWIHPFDDGNGRTARLLEFLVLLQSGVPSVAAHLLSNHYNATRTEYYRQLDATSKSGGDLLPFILYAVRGFVDQLREAADLIRVQQLQTVWINYVHDKFRSKTSAANVRRRRLVLALTDADGPVRPAEIRRLTPELHLEYKSRTAKTVMRDVNALVKVGLLREEQGGYVANMEQILAFLPVSFPDYDMSEAANASGQLDLGL